MIFTTKMFGEYEWLVRSGRKIPSVPFTTDGCSGGMTAMWKILFNKVPPWNDCCIQHDIEYFMGGTVAERKQADADLSNNVARKGHPIIGLIMYYGVRMGGVPWLPTSWRWGYGWGRKITSYKNSNS